MGYAIGSLTKGTGDDTHRQLIATIKAVAEANGWTTVRYTTTTANVELILKGVGLSGDDEIFIGFQTMQDVTNDMYCMNCAVMSGYTADAIFANQPGVYIVTTASHNNSLGYFISMNAQRIALCLRIAGATYAHVYLGKIFPYAKPSEFPMPLVCGGPWTGSTLYRYDSTSPVKYMPYSGYGYGQGTSYFRSKIRILDGTWNYYTTYPFSQDNNASNALFGQGSSLVPADGNYQIEPVILLQVNYSGSPANVYGEFDGIFAISGYNNQSENVLQIGGDSVVDQTGMTVLQAVDAILAANGRAFVVLKNDNASTSSDFVAMEMTK